MSFTQLERSAVERVSAEFDELRFPDARRILPEFETVGRQTLPVGTYHLRVRHRSSDAGERPDPSPADPQQYPVRIRSVHTRSRRRPKSTERGRFRATFRERRVNRFDRLCSIGRPFVRSERPAVTGSPSRSAVGGRTPAERRNPTARVAVEKQRFIFVLTQRLTIAPDSRRVFRRFSRGSSNMYTHNG